MGLPTRSKERWQQRGPGPRPASRPPRARQPRGPAAVGCDGRSEASVVPVPARNVRGVRCGGCRSRVQTEGGETPWQASTRVHGVEGTRCVIHTHTYAHTHTFTNTYKHKNTAEALLGIRLHTACMRAARACMRLYLCVCVCVTQALMSGTGPGSVLGPPVDKYPAALHITLGAVPR